MIAGVGVDIVDVGKVARLVRQHPQRLNRIFTAAELKRCGKRAAALAEIFAAKEAVLKVLGTGWVSGLTWTDVEIGQRHGCCRARLKGGAAKIARRLKIADILVDVSSSSTKAVAHAIGVRTDAMVSRR